MHIEEPTTQKFEVDASQRWTQVFSEQGQLSAPPTLENCEKLQSALLMALAKDDFLVRVRKIVDCIDPEISLEDILQASVKEVRKFFQTDRVGIYQIFPESGIVAVDSDSSVLANLYSTSGLVTPILLPQKTGDNQSSGQMMMWGMVIIDDSRISRTWETREIDTLKQVSREIAIAIEKSQLRQQIKIAETASNQALDEIATTQQEITQIQTQLLQKAKLSTLGQLIVDLVNEIHNPVNFIFSSIYSTSQYAEDLIHLLEQYQHNYPIPPNSASPQKLTNIDSAKTEFLKSLWSMRAGSERLKDTVSALYKFSQFDNTHLKKTDLHEGINSILTILQHRLKEKAHRAGIQVNKKFGDIPLVECFPGEVNQVFLNILTNAIEALEERMHHDYSFAPKIWISTEIVNSHLSLISSNGIKPANQPNQQKQKILICISDNGNGILPHIQRRIFEPFFSTKPIDKGNGLGLAISRKIIVEKHRGKLGCKSQLGKGSEFFIEINTAAKQYVDIRKHASF
ncbi:GAF domain-containing sensor histidine kinase [Brunnivagina elsteri]|uniref:histidine kinase n=1 Tax=Brunnivagina elsteri CCALA 953 TaxID=987040 RepID=A0A2A2TFJ2_9CYAN|nr:GAF domain-containing sensor histidine kinase [Calothrix elsteri]PAX52502.1 histidine kinase [Calothrix elsteri CCALA 953]